MNFLTELSKRILVLDGSMGALLQNRGLPAGMAPDVWMMDHADVIERAHRDYAEAGADILLSNTFGATRWRLAEYDSHTRIREINARAVEIARKAGGAGCFVAGDIGPSGETVFPTGKKSFEEVCEIFYEQAKILVELGVDLIVVETMFDSLEFRAALSAVRAASQTMPLIGHATFNTDGITDTGASPENIAAIAEGFHATGVGVNCSTGPEPMVGIVEKMAKLASSLVISVQPNAGLPHLKGGRTQFPMGPQDLEPFIDRFVDAGAGIIGGCCGTTPDYIRLVKEKVRGRTKFRQPARDGRVVVSSLFQAVRLGGRYPFVGIGERMNPSGRKKLSECLKKGELTLLLQDAEQQVAAGAKLMDLNVGVPLVDEPALMREAVVAVQNRFQVPLMIDSANTHALDTGASVYYGRPLLNSLNAEQEKLDEAIPVMKKHGAAIVCMTTGVDVPVLAEDRLKNAQNITKQLFEKHGFREEDIVFDVLGLVVSAMQDGSKATLRTIELVKEYFPRSATTLGLSNVSFGLPNRAFVHNAFLALAVQRGLDSAIMSVTEPMGPVIAASAEMWGAKPESINTFIQGYSQKIELGHQAALVPGSAAAVAATAQASVKEPEWVDKLPALEKGVFRSIVDGQKETTERLLNEYIVTLDSLPVDAPMKFFLSVMTPAIRHLGDLFGARIKFIPHLMAAAEAMKCGVAILEPFLLKARQASGQKRGTVVFATVKGDIHDIGKNICILMLKNFGFEVVDLGRNVDPELILRTAVERKAEVVALSALMTTTMMQMKIVIDAVKERKLPFKVVIGGAVVTPDFAREIQADGFSTDVGTVVSEMERVIALLQAAGAV